MSTLYAWSSAGILSRTLMATPCVNHCVHKVLHVNTFTAHKYIVCLVKCWNLVKDSDANTMCQPLYAQGVTCRHLCSTAYTLYAWSNAKSLSRRILPCIALTCTFKLMHQTRCLRASSNAAVCRRHFDGCMSQKMQASAVTIGIETYSLRLSCHWWWTV